MTFGGRLAATTAVAGILAMAGCAGLDRNDQGRLQPQTVRGPCDVTKFFLLSQTAVHTEMTVASSGQACEFTVLDPNLQAFPSGTLVTVNPEHGRAQVGFANGGRSPAIAYTPQPGYVGADRFTVTIEPNDHAIAVAVSVRPAG